MLSVLVLINCFGTGFLVSKLSHKYKIFERLGPGEKMYKNSQFLVFCNALYLNNGKTQYDFFSFRGKGIFEPPYCTYWQENLLMRLNLLARKHGF